MIPSPYRETLDTIPTHLLFAFDMPALAIIQTIQTNQCRIVLKEQQSVCLASQPTIEAAYAFAQKLGTYYWQLANELVTLKTEHNLTNHQAYHLWKRRQTHHQHFQEGL